MVLPVILCVGLSRSIAISVFISSGYVPCLLSGMLLSVFGLFVAMESYRDTTGREWRGQIDMDGALD